MLMAYGRKSPSYAVLQIAYANSKCRDFKEFACHQIGITFPGMMGLRGGMIHQGGAQWNADSCSHRDTGISDASGVQPEAPKGGRFRFLAPKRPGR